MANETAFSYQAPDRLIYNLLTGADAATQIDPETGDYEGYNKLKIIQKLV